MQRNYGLDLCRTVAMAMIVLLHVLGQGGLLNAFNPAGGGGYWTVYGMETVAICSVDLFAMLSGYLSENDQRFATYRIVELISIVFFYIIPLFFLFLVLFPETVTGMKNILCALFPPFAGRYWYITCYIPLAMIRPYINKGLHSLSISQHRNLCVICFVLFMCIPNIIHTDLFRFEYGYSFVWLMTCYIVGAYIRRGNISIKRVFSILTFFVCTGTILLCRFVMNLVFPRGANYMMTYTSPFEFLMAVSLLLICCKIRFQKERVEKIWKVLSSAAFDVYILHSYILIFDYWLKDRFLWIAQLSLIWVPFCIIACVLAIYAAGVLSYFLRQWIYKVLHLQKFLHGFSNWLDRYVYYNEKRCSS